MSPPISKSSSFPFSFQLLPTAFICFSVKPVILSDPIEMLSPDSSAYAPLSSSSVPLVRSLLNELHHFSLYPLMFSTAWLPPTLLSLSLSIYIPMYALFVLCVSVCSFTPNGAYIIIASFLQPFLLNSYCLDLSYTLIQCLCLQFLLYRPADLF